MKTEATKHNKMIVQRVTTKCNRKIAEDVCLLLNK